MMRLWLALLCLLAWVPAARAEARVLALTPAACEMLYAIGAGPEIVGASEHCDYPAAARRLPRVADYRRLFVEPALRLKPTLAVTGAADLAGLASLKAAGVRVMLVHPASVRDVLDAMQALGEATGHVAGAGRAVAAMHRRLARIAVAAAGPPMPVFYEDWSQPLLTEGGSSFITDALARIGARNVFGTMPMETLRTSVEEVVRARPQAIIVPGASPAMLAKRRAFWRRWLPGVPVLSVDANLMQRPGPRLVDGMAELQRRLQQADGHVHAGR
jgi:ABC-type hemin transport system substrate-binding protein